jgi:tryptophan synthase beta chain
MDKAKFILDEKKIPTHWYNIQADLPEPLPPYLHPGTKEPTRLPPPLFCEAINTQEFSKERYIEIPDEVREVYRVWRPTVLQRAYRLEKALGTPAKIYYKFEDSSPAGSHKPNTAIAQAYYNKKEGVKRVASPSPDTKVGRDLLAKDPNNNGSLGFAISEACEDAFSRDDTKYSLGSVLNHVLLHQTVIGQEAMLQMEMAGNYPDIIIGCVGGGSNFAGLFLPFVKDKISGKKKNTRIICAEPTSCPSLTKGPYTWDLGDVAGMAPIAKMYTLGHDFMPPPVHAGGLRYHGMSPLVSHLYKHGYIEAKAVPQVATFEAGVTFARSEGFISAPETNHAIRVTIDEALKCKESGEAKTILFCHSGHGHFDMAAYEQYLAGKLTDYEFPEAAMKESLKTLPEIPAQFK